MLTAREKLRRSVYLHDEPRKRLKLEAAVVPRRGTVPEIDAALFLAAAELSRSGGSAGLLRGVWRRRNLPPLRGEGPSSAIGPQGPGRTT